MTKSCLYCEKDRQKTDEHVLQKAFGTSATLKDEVCGICNTEVFSPLDGHLVEHIKTLTLRDHPDVNSHRHFLSKGIVHHRDELNGVWLSVRIDSAFKGNLFDQIIDLGGGRIHIELNAAGRGTAEDRVKLMFAELGEPAKLALTELIVESMDPEIEPALVRTAPRTYVVRGASSAATCALRAKIASGHWSRATTTSAPTSQTIESPHIQGLVKFRENAILRALTKVSINFVAYSWGPELAREPRFAHARSFALGETEQTDGFRVQLLDSKQDDDLGLLCKPHHHTIVLSPSSMGVTAKIFLYQRPVALVLLSASVHASDKWTVGLFDYRRHVHRLVDENTMTEPVEDWLA